MPAGGSALRRSIELDDEADVLFRLGVECRREAENYRAADASERGLAERISTLDLLGWQVLADRRWPGSTRSNVDFILVGPGGVVALDAKWWSEMELRDGSIYRGDVREDDELDKLTSLVDALADALAPTGLTANAVSVAMVFTGRQVNASLGAVDIVGDADVATYLSGMRRRLSPERVAELVAALDDCCPPMEGAPLARVEPRPAEPRVADEPLVDVAELTRTLLASALAGPLEDWMTFLHPDQNKLVRSQWNGPARVRGSAGTGKTVVGLHRAVHLAQRSADPVLFVSFVRTLPAVLASLARQLSPRAAENITFVGVHELASRCLAATRVTCRPDSRAAERAFDAAWRSTGAALVLGRLDERPAYWREEIDHVIKGRGINDLGAYLSLQRVGRRTPMRAEDRSVMWRLHLAYQDELRSAGAHDFNDLLLLAREAVETHPSLFRFSSVIVDEVQDLNLAGIQLLRALAGDGPNRLLLIGDGQQSVYPGGFTLAEAGITVAGRASVLRSNYRNTVEILRQARQVVGTDTFEDLEGVSTADDGAAEASRSGYPTQQVHFGSRRELDTALVDLVRRTAAPSGRGWAGLAVLCERRADVARFRGVLSGAGIPVLDLEQYDGTSVDAVKVGTIKRAKGLEFPFVFLPGLRTGDPDPLAGETDSSHAERCERRRRELFVAMTRARDGLWLGYLA